MSFEETLAALLDAHIEPLRLQIQRLTAELRAASYPEQSEFLSVPDAAKLAAVSEATVRDWMTKGLKRYGQGRVVRVRRAELLVFLSANPGKEGEEIDVEEQAVAILSRSRGR